MTQLRTELRGALGVLLVAVGCLGMAEGARAQGAIAEDVALPSGGTASDLSAPKPRTFGTESSVAYTIPAYLFQARDGTTISNTGPYNRFHPMGAEVLAPVQLPAGAMVTSVELEGCDTDPAEQIVFVFFRVDNTGDNTNILPLGGTGITAAPGCGFFPRPLTTPHTIDNRNNVYYVAVNGGPDPVTSYTAVRVFYDLQVSPAPAVATFSDVPTSHPFFQFVEALAASGITVGCGGGNFCPDVPLTRGQMAVFLSRGLGLHFAP